MYARVTTFHGIPDRFEQGVRALGDAASELHTQQGFAEGVLLIDREASTGMAITIWENEGVMNDSSAFAQTIFARAKDALSGQPERQTYEVLEHRHGQGKKYARASSGNVSSEMLDSGNATAASIIEAASKQPGFTGFLLLGDRSRGRLLGISFWDSEAHMTASEHGYYSHEMEKSRDNWQDGWTKNIYEVAAEV